MKKHLASLLLAFSFLSTPPANSADKSATWDITKMNYQIENTNVIVGGVCSGTIISKAQRLVLTAFHCVDSLFKEVTEKIVDTKTGEIKEITKQKLVPLNISVNKVRDFEIVSTSEFAAKIVGSDKLTDVALVQVTDTDWAPIDEALFASDTYSYQRGLHIYAVGNPAIQFDNSITEGIISSPQRTLNIGGNDLKVFQHSASVIGGNSGGAILNDDGELIGTLSAGVPGADISFAVPISYSKVMIRKAGFGGVLEGKRSSGPY